MGYIDKTELRGITLSQLDRVVEFGRTHCEGWHDTRSKARVNFDCLNLHQFNDWCIMPATNARNCAFVELMTGTEQKPEWFCSHWWGEPIKDFLACVRTHVLVRQLPNTAPFWVCAHANRQHSLSQELTADPSETSFFKAMRLARGVLLILDRNATPFTRIWCCYEEYVALMCSDGRKKPMLLDIATTSSTGVARILTDGVTDAERKSEYGPSIQVLRQLSFPLEVLRLGIRPRIQDANATEEKDKRHILNKIAEKGLEDAPCNAHPNYDKVNRSLGATFANAGWMEATMMGKARELGIPEAMAANPRETSLDFDFTKLDPYDADLALRFQLAPQMHSLHVNLKSCKRFTDSGWRLWQANCRTSSC